MRIHRRIRAGLVTAALTVGLAAPWAQATRPDWQRREVDWRAGGGRRIKAVRYPAARPVPACDTPHVGRARRAPRQADTGTKQAATAESGDMVLAYVIDSPPVDGFIPWIAVLTTDERGEPLDTAAVPELSPVGDYTCASPASDYVIGLYDTGASAHVMGNAAATAMGLFAGGYVTINTATISGVTGEVDAWITDPIGLFMDGLGRIDPDTLLLDLDSNASALVGESNVSILVGQPVVPPQPDLPTALGTPVASYFAAVIRNDQVHTITRDGQTYRAPDIRFYDLNDPQVPDWSRRTELALRPQGLGSLTVQYFPCIEIYGGDCPGGADRPIVPSVIADPLFLGNQSLFFFESVNLADNGYAAQFPPYNDEFMLDTGAQVTVIGTSVATVLRLDENAPDFEVEIQGVTGEISIEPGFYIDSIEIPALGGWLSYTNVPVVLLDIASPEGGNLDGIIGMNLFLRYNLVLRGGGLSGYAPPMLRYQFITIDADFDNDGDVDQSDFGYLQACLTGENVAQDDPGCAAARLDGDTDVDQADLLLFQSCTSGPGILADPDCTQSLTP